MDTQIGYSLVDKNGTKLQFWGDVAGQCVGIPNVIKLPNGDEVHCPALGPLQQWKLVPRLLAFDSKASAVFDGSNMVITRALSQMDYQVAVESLVNQTAQSRQYDSGISLAGYVASTVPQWAAESQAFIAWRDQVWSYVYQALADVEQAKRAQPLVPDLIAELPAIAWPA